MAKHDKPCVATFLGMRGVDGGMRYTADDGQERSVPSYSMPEDGFAPSAP